MNVVVREILAPSVARIGSATAGFLVASGGNRDLSEQVGVGVVALILIGVDLAIGHYTRKKL